MMVVYILPKGVHSAFNKELSRFFWQAANDRQEQLALCEYLDPRTKNIYHPHHVLSLEEEAAEQQMSTLLPCLYTSS